MHSIAWMVWGVFKSPHALSPPSLSAPVSRLSQPDLSLVSLFKQETYGINVGQPFQEFSCSASDHKVFSDRLFQLLSCPQVCSVSRTSSSYPMVSGVHDTMESSGESLKTIDPQVAPSSL